MGMTDHNSLGGIGANDRNRTLFTTYTRLYGRPVGDEFENAVDAFEKAGGDIRPLSIPGLFELRDGFRAFLCCRGSRFSDGVHAWLDSNDHLQHTLFSIAMLMPRDKAIERVQSELLGNAFKAFGIVSMADNKVWDPLSGLLDTPMSNDPRNLALALRAKRIPLKAAAALTSWCVLSGKRKRIMDALLRRSDVDAEDKEMQNMTHLRDALELPDAGYLLKELSRTSLSAQAEDDKRHAHHLHLLYSNMKSWHDTYAGFIPTQERSPDMHPLAYLRYIRGVPLSAACRETIPAAIHEETQRVQGLHAAIAFLVPILQEATNNDTAPLAFTFSSNEIMLARESILTSIQPPDREDVLPLPGLMPKGAPQAQLIVGWKRNALQRFIITYPVAIPR